MSVKVPSPEEIRELLARKKREADAVEVKVGEQVKKAAELDVALRERDELLKDKAAEVEKLQVELAKLKDRGKMSVGVMRGKLDELIKRHGCEPADELLRMTMERVPVVNGEGVPLMDAEGRPIMRWALPPELRANVLLKLMEFRMPKLRSTETQGQMDVDVRVVVVRFGDMSRREEREANARVIDA